MERLIRISGLVSRGIEYFSGGLILVMMLIVTYSVAMRYLFGRPQNWMIDVSIYLIVLAALPSIISTTFKEQHVKVEIVTRLLSARTNNILRIVAYILPLVFMGFLFWYGTELTIVAFQRGMRYGFTWMQWPQGPTRLAVPVTALGTAYVLVIRLYAFIRSLRQKT